MEATTTAEPPFPQRGRRAAVSSEPVSHEAIENWEPPVYPKTEDERVFLRDVVNNKLGMLFGHLTVEHRDSVISAMDRKSFKKGEVIIEQGDNGDYFYIVGKGVVDIFVKRNNKDEAEKVMTSTRGGSFGELALLYNAPRAATCLAVEDCDMWSLDRESFKMMLVTSENTKKRRYEGFLEDIEIFKGLNRYERCQLSDILTTQTVEAGSNIITQGENGDRFYILEDGAAVCTMREKEGPELEVCRYSRGSYFGELALMCDEPRKTTITAEGVAKLLWIDKSTFDRVLGPIIDILRENADKYPKYQDFLNKATPATTAK